MMIGIELGCGLDGGCGSGDVECGGGDGGARHNGEVAVSVVQWL